MHELSMAALVTQHLYTPQWLITSAQGRLCPGDIKRSFILPTTVHLIKLQNVSIMKSTQIIRLYLDIDLGAHIMYSKL